MDRDSKRRVSPASPTAEDAARRFGTFGGVFTPVVLTILGVIMFMRTGFVAGHVGLWMGLIILGLSKLITTLTTLSLSAVATNQRVKGGGVYYMISRVLGPDFGGSIGITLFFAQTVGIAFYVIGFTEALFDVVDPLLMKVAVGDADLATMLLSWRAPQIVSTVVLGVLFLLTFKGADVAIKAQYAVLAVLLLAVASFVVGGVLGFDPQTMWENAGPDGDSGVGFWTAFAIFFPAATGITAGANMSGDLKRPERAIPVGTLLAIAFTAVVYVTQYVLMSGSVERTQLQESPFAALAGMSVFGPLVVLGVFAATLSSAIGSFLGAPRILQAMGRDRLMKVMEFFGKGSGEANEPRRATVLTLVIATGVIWAGDLNAVAPVISMFFLIAYGMINLSAFVESRGGNPSFRPRFRAFHWTLALAGAAGCVVAMVKIDETYAIVAIAVTGIIYFWLRKRDISAEWGDARRGYIFQSTRENLMYLERSPVHPKNWRPILATVSDDAETIPVLAGVGSWIESERGLLTVAHVLEAPGEPWSRRAEMCRNRVEEMRRQLEVAGIEAFPEAVAATDCHEALGVFLRSHAIGGLRANSVMLALPDRERAEARERFFGALDLLAAFERNILVLKPGQYDPDKRARVIDIWWRGERNGSLMAILAYLVTLHEEWPSTAIRIFRIVHGPTEKAEARTHLETLGRRARIPTSVTVIDGNGRDPLEIVADHSGPMADLVFLGMNMTREGAFRAFAESNEDALARLPTTIFVWSNGEADVSE